MAFLVILFSFVSATQAAQIPPLDGIDSEFLYSQAVRSLESCQWSRAKYWAEVLERRDTELADLYRLAWLQQPPAGNGSEAYGDTERTTLRWKWDGEIWADERDLWHGGSQCGAGRKNLSFAQLPPRAVAGILSKYLARYDVLQPVLKRVLRDYVFHQWLGGTRIKGLIFSERSDCAWRALAALHSGHPFVEECELDQSLSVAVSVAAGDFYFGEGAWDRAFASYERGVSKMNGQRVHPRLWYRVAVSAGYGTSRDDAFFRAAEQVLVATTGTEGIDPIYQGSLRNIACEKFLRLGPEGAVQVLAQVFKKERWMDNVMDLTSSCPRDKMSPYWRALLIRAFSDQERARLYGELFSAALVWGKAAEPHEWVSRLAELSRRLPQAASRIFWDAMIENQGRGEWVSLYRQRGKWTDLDTQREQRWKKGRGLSASTSDDTRLIRDSKRSVKVLRLPLARELPAVPFDPSVPVDFSSLLDQHLKANVSQ